MSRYIILDRDGTLIEHVHHLVDIEKVKLLPGVSTTLKAACSLGFRLGIVTNQSVIDRGMITIAELHAIHNMICEQIFAESGVTFDFIEFCPHLPTADCECRKPRTALLAQKIINNEIDTHSSFMVGDQESDIIFGKALGLKTIKLEGKRDNSNNFLTSADFSISTFSALLDILIKEKI